MQDWFVSIPVMLPDANQWLQLLEDWIELPACVTTVMRRTHRFPGKLVYADLYVVGFRPDELELGKLSEDSWKPCEARCQPFDWAVGFIHCLSSRAVKVGKAVLQSDCQRLSC